jgi:hypothetical protein
MTQVKPTPEEFDLATVEWIGSAHHPSDKDDQVEVAFVDSNVLMRNRSAADRILVFTQAEWEAFVSGALDGEFDY